MSEFVHLNMAKRLLLVGFAFAAALIGNGSNLSAQSPEAPQPAIVQGDFPLVSSEEAEHYFRQQVRDFPEPRILEPSISDPLNLQSSLAPQTTNLGAAAMMTVAAEPEIVELARGLRNNVDLIYEHVYNNFRYEPIFGLRRGAVGAIIDEAGNSFDQSAAMVALLRQAQYPTKFVYGTIRLSPVQLTNWLGVSESAATVSAILGSAGIPGTITTSDGTINGTLIYAELNHVWVKVTIGGTDYVFDPAFKFHSVSSGVDLPTAMGYNRETTINAAMAGASNGGDRIDNVNHLGLRNTLSGYATNLVNHIRTNNFAAGLEDIVGGRAIIPVEAQLRQTSLPYQQSIIAEWEDIPNNMRATLRIKYQNINELLYADEIYTKRLTLFYSASNQPVLRLDGNVVATGSAIAPGVSANIEFEVKNPYPGNFGDLNRSAGVSAGGSYLIVNSFGNVSSRMVDRHRKRLNAGRQAGVSDSSEVMIGSSLAVMGTSWLAQTSSARRIVDQLGQVVSIRHMTVGISGREDDRPFIDLPLGLVSNVSLVNDLDERFASFFNGSGVGSAFESGIIEQIHDVPASSTVALLDLAVSQGDTIYDVTSANWASIEPQLEFYSPQEIAAVEARINSNFRVLLPKNGNLNKGTWQGVGFLAISSDQRSIGHIITGGQKGGFAGGQRPPQQAVADSGNAFLDAFDYGVSKVVELAGDPVAMFTGDLVVERDDISVGSGVYPFGLGLQRSYNSGSSLSDGPFGLGWTHNFDIGVQVNSSGFQGLGEDSPVDAAAAIVALYVAQDLFVGTKTMEKLVIGTMVQNWGMDNLIDNAVTIVQPGDTQLFIKLADGSFNPPPGRASTLNVEADQSYLLTTKYGLELDFNIDGQLTEWRNPNNVTVTFNYTSDRLSSVSNNMGRTLTFSYSSDRISSVSDGTGRSVAYSYDVAGNLIEFTDAESNKTVYAYGDPGKLTQIFNPSFPTIPFITNIYDSRGRVMQQTSAGGDVWQYFYSGHRTDLVEPLNSQTVTRYFNDQGRTIQVDDQLGNTTLSKYDGEQRIVERTLPEGNSISTEYDNKHNVTKISVNPKPGSPLAPIVQFFTYDPTWNRVVTETDARGNVSTNSYDQATGNLLTVVEPAVKGLTPTTIFTYNSRGQTETVTDPTSKVVRNIYDPVTADLLSVVEDDGGLELTSQFSYDPVGNVVSGTDPKGHVTTRSYDNERRSTLATTPAPFSFQTKTIYDKDGRVIKVEEQTGDAVVPWQVTEITYTVFGAMETITDPGGHVTAYLYDELDRVRQVTDAEGRIQRSVYDAVGRVLELREVPNILTPAFDQTLVSYSYTDNGQINSQSDGNGNTTTYFYDDFDRLIRTTLPDSSFGEVTLDATGNVLTRRTRGGDNFSYTYDALNRLDAENVPYSATDIDYNYDLDGRLISVSDQSGTITYGFDSAKRLESITRQDTKVVSYQYDAAGNRTRLTWPDGSFVTYDVDELDRITHIRDGGITPLAVYQYDALSRTTEVTYNNGVGASVAFDWQPDDDDLNSVSHAFDGGLTSVSFSYGYNQVNQQTSLTVTDDQYLWRPANAQANTYTPNNLNQYSSISAATIAYDGNGNLSGDGTNNYTFDAKNRLIAATTLSQSVTYAYDAFDRRVAKTVDGTTTKFLLDGAMEIAEYDGADTLLRRYVYGPNTTAPVVEISASGTKRFLHGDGIGSVVAVTDNLGSVTESHGYGPFGEVENLTGAVFRYTGQRLDPETGLYYFRARYYSAANGRFLSPDPIGYGDGPNLYAYVGNDPLNNVDPTGLTAVAASNLANEGWRLTKKYGAKADKALQAADEVAFIMSATFGASLDTITLGPSGVETIAYTAVAYGAIKTTAAASRGIRYTYQTVSALYKNRKVEKIIEVSRAKYGDAAAHIADAQNAGHPSIVTIFRPGASANRNQSIGGIPKVPGKQLDEYPPAMFKEGGTGASVRAINPSNNMGAGACIGNACRGIPNGGKVRIKVVD